MTHPIRLLLRITGTACIAVGFGLLALAEPGIHADLYGPPPWRRR